MRKIEIAILVACFLAVSYVPQDEVSVDMEIIECTTDSECADLNPLIEPY